jgi:hypothetical protein
MANRKGYCMAAEGLEVPEGIKWAQLKSVERAVEKVVRVYNKVLALLYCLSFDLGPRMHFLLSNARIRGALQDVSLLLDVCRQAIVYESVAALTTGLWAIAADDDVVLVRVKNRMRDGCPADETAGYRDVVINVRVVNESARKLGVETHVAEIQLVLRAINNIKVIYLSINVGNGGAL